MSNVVDNKTITINQAFSENRFNLFVKYCNDNGFIFLDDLKNFDFYLLHGIKGMGVGKINEILLRYIDILRGNIDISNNEQVVICGDTIFENINSQILKADITFLKSLGIKNKIILQLQANNINKIGDLKGIAVGSLIHIVSQRNIDKFRHLETVLQKNAYDILEDILGEMSKTEEYEMVLMKAVGFTLSEIGVLRGVTRERIRQIIKKMINKLDPIMYVIIKRYIDKKGYATIQDLMDIYDNDDFDKILIYWAKNTEYIKYFELGDVFLPIEADIEQLHHKLLKITEDFIGDGINLDDHLDELEFLMNEYSFQYVNRSTFIDILLNNGYKIYKNFAVKGNQSYGYLCSKIIGRFFPDGIKLYGGEDLVKLRKLAYEEFGDIDLPSDDRALSARISSYTVLCGKGCVTVEENIKMDMDLLYEIKEYIDSLPEFEVYYMELFNRFEDKLKEKTNIDNYHFLHGVIKLYYGDEYDFSSKTHLTKKGEGLTSGKLSIKIDNYIMEKDQPVTRKELRDKFAISDIMLVNIVLNDKYVLQWDFNTIFSLKLLSISDEDLQGIRKIIDEIMLETTGYCSDNLLYEKVCDRMPEFICKNRIKNANNLFFLCAKCLKDIYDFRRPHIVKQGLIENISLKNVILHLLNDPNHLSYGKYRELCDYFKWSDVTNSMVFYDIEKDYVRISDDEYVKKTAFEMDEDTLKAVEDTLTKQLDEGYLSLINFDRWYTLPECKYEWNQHLLRSVIDKYINSLKIIETRTRDRRYERGIIIKASEPIYDYETLVYNIFKNKNVYEISENNMLTLLVQNNLTYKLIPKELYNGNKISYKNEKFILKR